jgi:hypothetical protein
MKESYNEEPRCRLDLFFFAHVAVFGLAAVLDRSAKGMVWPCYGLDFLSAKATASCFPVMAGVWVKRTRRSLAWHHFARYYLVRYMCMWSRSPGR